MKVGFIGVGTMGRPMSLNLMKVGYELTVYDINPQPLKELQEKGAAVGQSIRGVAGKSEVVITMVPNSGDVEKVILGKDGVLEGLKSHSIVIDMSTIDPSVSRKIAKTLREKDIHMLDAPVSGGQMGAEAGTLAIMVGGEEDVFQKCLPILKAMGKNIYYCGPNGNGEIVKIINNLMAGVFRMASAEALALGVKAGVPLKVLYDVVNESSGQSRIVQVFGAAKAFKGDYEPGFASELMHKDLGLALNLGKEERVPLPLGALAHQLFTHLLSLGLGKKDTGVIFKVLEDLLNIKIRF
jgi:2-hydroxy-3-oxopropionate reductase/2-hydroxymethylglutarate dehydrogenase